VPAHGARYAITAESSFYAEPFYLANGDDFVTRATDRDGSEYLEMIKQF
jgi:hypothetical protein